MAESLNNGELEAVTRHEFGHALGLPELDFEAGAADYKSGSYISKCYIDLITSPYNEQKITSECG